MSEDYIRFMMLFIGIRLGIYEQMHQRMNSDKDKKNRMVSNSLWENKMKIER